MTLPHGSVWLDAEGSQGRGRFGRRSSEYVARQAAAVLSKAPEAIRAVALSPDLPLPRRLDGLLGPGALRWKEPGAPSQPPQVFHAMSPLMRIGPFPAPLAPVDEVWPRWAREEGVGLVVTLLDAVPLELESLYLEPDPIFASAYRSRLELIRTANQVLTLTEETATTAVEWIGVEEGRVTVVGQGPAASFDPRPGSGERTRGYLETAFPLVRPGFMLCVVEDEPSTNLTGLIDAYARLPEHLRAQRQLVIICELPGRRRRELLGRAGRLGVRRDEFLIADSRDDVMLAALFGAGDLYVSPSLHDGSGLSIVEAMSHGMPVTAGDTGCAREVLGDARAIFDPQDPAAIADCLGRLLAAPDELAALRERSRARAGELSWDRVAQETLEAYERAVPRRARKGRRSRPRLAMLTPWPPQRSGVANHSHHLVGALSAYADIDVVVPPDNDVDGFDAGPNSGVAIRPAAEFDWLPELRAYDRILYVLGNSEFHVHVLRLLTKRSGHVLMHDVRLTGLYTAASHEPSTGPDWLRDKLSEMYGGRIPRKELRRIPHFATEHRYGIFMTQEVQRRSEGILAHSHHALELLRLECPPGMTPPPSSVVAHGVVEPSVSAAGGSDSDAPVIVSYGIVGPTKGIDTMLHAFAGLSADRPGARLLLVGDANSLAREYVAEIASDLGITESVEVRGHVGKDEYWRTLAAADVALQLRTWSNGEASGAVIDCVAARVPTIATDIGWFSELPEGVVLPVPRDSSSNQVAERISEILDDPTLRSEVKAAQDDYVAANSYPAVARQYAEVLGL
jgi:glycosyltransferase involved in cell wall biosynthesis